MRERRRIIVAIGLVLVAVIVSYVWLSSERERQLAVQEVGSESLDVEATVLEDQSMGELEVKLFVYRPGAVSPDQNFLMSTSRTILQTEDEVLMARQVVNEVLKVLVKQPGGARTTSSPYAGQVKLRSLHILEDGTAVVDLPGSTLNGLAGGITSELALIRSITRSLRANILPVKQVRFLVDGIAKETLAGHVSIAHSFR
jgi:spore germination protein GerM